MLDPRIYRMGLLPVVLAVIVLAFSLGNQQSAVTTNVVPDAFNASHAELTMSSLAKRYPRRPPGSAGDRGVAGYVASRLNQYGYNVSEDRFQASTVRGTRPLENVVGVRAGGGQGSIVILSHRDALGSPAETSLSGTAVMLELARVLAGQSLGRTLVMASTTGSDGAAGAARLAARLPQPVDAVIALGDLAGSATRQPIVVPWSDDERMAPTGLRNTVGTALTQQTGLPAGPPDLGQQLAHLAFPMSGSEQVPFVSQGLPAVLLSLSGDHDPAATERPNPQRLSETGRALFESVRALQSGGLAAKPSSYLLLDGKVVPAWAIRLLVLVLMIPVLAVSIDGAARARRRGQDVLRWVGWVGAGALPFVAAAFLVKIAHWTGWIGPAPAAPVQEGSVPLGGGGIALLVLVGLLIVAGFVWLRPLLRDALGGRGNLTAPSAPAPGAVPGRARARAGSATPGAGAAAGLLLVMSVVALAVWVANPFAALLLLPALHLWIWVASPDVRLPIPVTILLVLAGLAPVALVMAAFAGTFGLGPVGLAWSGVLMLAGGGVGFLAAIEWSLLAACAIGVIVIAWRSAATRPQDVPVTVRGPVSYAGPGSLGGTESALRR